MIYGKRRREGKEGGIDCRKGDIRPVDGPRGAMRIGPISIQLVRDSMAHVGE